MIESSSRFRLERVYELTMSMGHSTKVDELVIDWRDAFPDPGEEHMREGPVESISQRGSVILLFPNLRYFFS